MNGHAFVIIEANNGYVVIYKDDKYVFDNTKDVLSFIEEKIYNANRNF